MHNEMIKPSLQEARQIATGGDYTLLPIAMEMFSDIKTSIEIFKAILKNGGQAYILESVESGESWGRYTFMGYKPKMVISGRGNEVEIKNGVKSGKRFGNPQQILKEIAAEYKSPRIEGLPLFTGGFVGYFTYEYIKNIETTLRLTDNDEIGFDDFRLMMFDNVIAIDNFSQKIYLITNIKTDDLERNYIEGVCVLKDMENLILSNDTGQEAPGGPMSEFAACFTKEQYCDVVERVKHYIREGDIFQCVPSNRFSAAYQGDLLQAYRILRTTNPSAYMFYMVMDDLQFAGASPETLVSLRDGVSSTFPLAGSCPRGKDDAETQRLIEDLLANYKELAEHDMLVDLGRNDLGKVSKFGTVKVEQYRGIKRCSHICHIASKVVGEIKEEFDAFDAIAAAIPAGTLSGAPKKRACEIIDEMEGRKRGIYGGAIGYIDFAGNMDMCIGIRMAVLKDGMVHVQAGGGVVADSVPEMEYQETLNKAQAMMDALKLSGEGMR